MHLTTLTNRLSGNAGVIRGLFADVSADEARWRPAADRWSMLEVLCHLADEEREDFRARLGFLLHHSGDYRHPEKPWPGIDPAAWVKDRDYNGRDLEASLAGFFEERDRSINWLAGLETPAWSNAYEHPLLGTLRAGDMAVSWLAHDLLHLRQLARLRFDRIRVIAPDFSTGYAGDW